MQLDKIVNYHKALSDPTRLRILLLLSKGEEIHGQALAQRLNLSQPTVTHHAAKLREAAMITERRDKNTVYFRMNPEFIRAGSEASLSFIFSKGTQEMEQESPENNLRESVLRNFLPKTEGCARFPPNTRRS